MRVLILTPAYTPLIGGSEIAISQVVDRLPDVFFDILTPRHSRLLPPLEKGKNFRVIRLGFGSRIDKFIFPVLGFLKVRKISPKIIHTFQASHAAGAAWLFKIFNPGSFFILTLQEGKDLDKQNFLKRFFRKILIRKADEVTAISRYLENYAQNQGAKKTAIIPNGALLEGAQLAVKSRIADDSMGNGKTIVTVSRLVPKNGVDILIRAFHILSTRYNIKDARLLVVGSGSEENNLKNLSKSLDLRNSINFIGNIPNERVYDYLAKADLFVRPSRSEGLGNAFLEAMAAGVAVIGTPVGGIPDFIKNGETGLFAEPENPEDLADKIAVLLNDDSLRKNIIAKAYNFVKEKYNWDLIAGQYKKIYENRS